MHKIFKQSIAISISIQLVVSPLAAGGLNIDLARNRGGASISSSSGGIDVVNISRVNGKRLSHNYFTDYNVKKDGLILNNSAKDVQTRIGGVVKGNENLQNNTAKLILNEITSTHKSDIAGVTEVAGDAADVIVANPNGIVVKGGGFINTPNAQLTTGRPVIKNEELDSLNIQGGKIIINNEEGYGLASQDNIQLSAHKIEVNSKIIANELDILGGKGIVDYKQGTIKDSGEIEPEQIVIDSSALGGMYANKIRIVVDSKGAGVNLGSDVISGAKGFTLDANGHVVLNKVVSSSDIKINSKSGEIGLKDNLQAGGNLETTGTGLSIAKDKKVIAGEKVEINSDLYTVNGGTIYAKDGVKLNSALIINEGGAIASSDNVEINSDVLNNNNGAIESSQKLNINSKIVGNQEGALVSSKETIITADEIDSREGYIVSENINIDATTIDNSKGAIDSQSDITITADKVVNDAGRFQAKDAISVGTYELSNKGGVIAAYEATAKEGVKAVDIIADESLDNSEGVIHSGGQAQLQSKNITSVDGYVKAKELTMISNRLDNTRGVITAEKTTLSSDIIYNDEGVVHAKEDLNIAGKMLSSQGGFIASEDKLQVNSETLLSDDGKITAKTAVLESLYVSNDRGIIETEESLNINSDSLSNQAGTIGTKTDLTLNIVENIDNKQGLIYADNTLLVNTKNLDSTQGDIVAKDINIETKNFDISSGTLAATQDLSLKSDSVINNEGRIQATSELDLQSKTLSNKAGEIVADEKINLQVQESVDNEEGTILTDGVLSFATKIINNIKGYIGSSDANIQSDSLDNTEGMINAQGDLVINATVIDSTKGVITGQNIDIQSQELQNSEGEIIADKNLLIDSAKVNNEKGLFYAADTLDIKSENLNSKDGSIAANSIKIDSTKMELADASLIANDSIELVSDELTAQRAEITAINSIEIDSKLVDIKEAKIVSNQQVSIKSEILDADKADIRSTNVLIETDELNNEDANIYAQDFLSIIANKLENLKAFFSDNDMSLEAKTGDITNEESNALAVNGNLQLKAAGNVKNEKDATISAGNQLLITADKNVENSGLIQSGKDLVVSAENLVNGKDIISGQHAALYAKDTLSNRGNIIAEENMLIAGDDEGRYTSNLENISGTIATKNADLYIYSDKILNTTGKELKSITIEGGEGRNIEITQQTELLDEIKAGFIADGKVEKVYEGVNKDASGYYVNKTVTTYGWKGWPIVTTKKSYINAQSIASVETISSGVYKISTVNTDAVYTLAKEKIVTDVKTDANHVNVHGNTISVTAKSIDELVADGTVKVDDKDYLSREEGAVISSGNSLVIATQELQNNFSTIQATKDLSVSSQAIAEGTDVELNVDLRKEVELLVKAQNDLLEEGKTATKTVLKDDVGYYNVKKIKISENWKTGAVYEDKNYYVTRDESVLSEKDLGNGQYSVVTAKQTDILSKAKTNLLAQYDAEHYDRTVNGNSVHITTKAAHIVNKEGLIKAGETLNLNGKIENLGGVIEGKDVALISENNILVNKTNTQQIKVSNGDSHSSIDRVTAGKIKAERDLTISTDELQNVLSSIEAGNNLLITNADELDGTAYDRTIDVSQDEALITQAQEDILKNGSYERVEAFKDEKGYYVVEKEKTGPIGWKGYQATVDKNVYLADTGIVLGAKSIANNKYAVSQTSKDAVYNQVKANLVKDYDNVNVYGNRVHVTSKATRILNDRGSIKAGDVLTLNGKVENIGGIIEGKDVYITSKNSALVNRASADGSEAKIIASRDLNIKADTFSDISLLKAGRDVSLTVTHGGLTNKAGDKIEAKNGSLNINTYGDITNNVGALMAAKEDLFLRSNSNVLNYGKISAGDILAIHAKDTILNSGDKASLEAVNNVYIAGGDNDLAAALVRNVDGLIQSENGDISIVTDRLENVTNKALGARSFDVRGYADKTLTADAARIAKVKQEFIDDGKYSEQENVKKDAQGYYTVGPKSWKTGAPTRNAIAANSIINAEANADGTHTVKTVNMADVGQEALKQIAGDFDGSKIYRANTNSWKGGAAFSVTAKTKGVRDLVAQNYDQELKPLTGAKINAKGNIYITEGAGSTSNTNGIVNTRSTIQAEGDVLVRNNGNIVNTGGYIAGTNVEVNSLQGNIVNDSVMQRINVYAKDGSGYTHAIGARGVIEGQDTVNVLADKDINFHAAEARAGKKLLIYSETGNIALKSKDANGYTGHANNNFQTKRKKASFLNSDGDLSIVSNAGSVLIQASDSAAAGDINILGKKYITVTAGNDQDYSYFYHKRTKKKWHGKKTTTVTIRESLKERVQTSDFDAGEDLTLVSDGDVNLQAVKVNAENIYVQSKDGDVNINAKSYTNDSYYKHTSKSGYFGFNYKSSSHSRRLKSKKYNSSDLLAQDDISVLAGNDINVEASNIVAGGNVNLDAVKDVTITSLNELEQREEKKSSSSMFGSLSSIYSMKEEMQGSMDETAKASLIQGGESVSINGENVNIIGSELNSAGNIDLIATNGNVNISAAKEKHSSYSYEKEINLGLGDVNPQDIISTKGGRLSVTLASGTYDELDEKSKSTTLSSAILNAGGSINIKSNKTIEILASNLGAKEDIILNAEEDVIIKEAFETVEEESKEVHGKVDASFGIKHQAIELSKAVVAVKTATKQLKAVKDSYKKYKNDISNLEGILDNLEVEYANKVPGADYADIVELKDLISDMKGDEKYFLLDLAAASANLASKATLLVQETAATAQSTGTYGFNADIQLDIDAVITKAESLVYTAQGSNLNAANNIIITAGEDAMISGSDLQAGNDISISATDVNIQASESSSSGSSSSKSAHLNVTYALHGGLSASASYNQSRGKNRSKTYTNSGLSAKNVSITSREDTGINGANIAADDTLNLEVAGNLDVTSKQDTSSSSNDSFGGSLGGSGSSVNGGINSSSGDSRSRQTVLTTLTGENIVINTGGNTHVGGAVISAVDEEGNDNGQLNLNTGTLTYANLSNTKYSNNKSFGIGTSVGSSSASDPKGNVNGDDISINSSTLSLTNNTNYEKTKTLATIGSGDITVGDTDNSSDLERLNRDTDAVDKDLYSVERQQGSVDLTLDHRLLSEEGRAEIDAQVDQYGQNFNKSFQDWLPSKTDDNAIAAWIGEKLELGASNSLGLIPSHDTSGGIISSLTALVFGDQVQVKGITKEAFDKLPDAEKEKYKLVTESGLDISAYKPTEDDITNMSKEDMAKKQTTYETMQTMYITDPGTVLSIDSDTATQENFTNGMNNTLVEALANGSEQTLFNEKGEMMLNYNPTHGIASDLFIEIAWDKVVEYTGASFLASGSSHETGGFIAQTVNARDDAGANFVAHSQGNILVNNGINTLSDGSINGKNIYAYSNGSPVSNELMHSTLKNQGINYVYSQVNGNDPIGETLTFGENYGVSTYGPEGKETQSGKVGDAKFWNKFWSLGDGKYGTKTEKASPHSTYYVNDKYYVHDTSIGQGK